MLRMTVVLGLASSMVACSPVMEAYRPDPVDMTQFKVGEPKLEVLKELGPPLASAKQGANSCDLYQLYIHGPASGGKAAIAAGEAVTDVFTLGLAEVIWTPTEVLTKNSKYPVTMCYDPDDKLVSAEAAEKPAGETQQPAAGPAPPGSSPGASPPSAATSSADAKQPRSAP